MVVHAGPDAGTAEVCARDWAGRGVPWVLYFAYPHKNAALQRDFAVRRSTHDVMFADDDMEFEPRWVEELLGVILGDPTIGATMGRILINRCLTPGGGGSIRASSHRPIGRASWRGVGALVPNGLPTKCAHANGRGVARRLHHAARSTRVFIGERLCTAFPRQFAW